MKTANTDQYTTKHILRLCICLEEAVRFAENTNAGTHNAGMWATAIAEAKEMLQKESAENAPKI